MGRGAECPLLSPSAAQRRLGGGSRAGPQQNQPCLGFSIIKYVTSQPTSASLEIHTESQMLVLFAKSCFSAGSFFFFVCNAGGRALGSTPIWLVSYARSYPHVHGGALSPLVPGYKKSVPLTLGEPLQLRTVQLEASSTVTSNKMATALCTPGEGWSLPFLE